MTTGMDYYKPRNSSYRNTEHYYILMEGEPLGRSGLFNMLCSLDLHSADVLVCHLKVEIIDEIVVQQFLYIFINFLHK